MSSQKTESKEVVMDTADVIRSRYLSEAEALVGTVIDSHELLERENGFEIIINERTPIKFYVRSYGDYTNVSQSVSGGQLVHTWKGVKIVEEKLDFLEGILDCLKLNVENTGEPVSLKYFHDYIFRNRTVARDDDFIEVYEFFSYHQDDFPYRSFFRINRGMLLFEREMFGWEIVPPEYPF